MEAGIIAAVVILSVELIIIVAVLTFLFVRKNPRGNRETQPDLEQHKKELPKEDQKISLAETKVENKEDDVKEEKQPESSSSSDDEIQQNEERTVKEIDAEMSSTSSDEGVGDVEKAASSGNDSSSSSTSEDEKEKKKEVKDEQDVEEKETLAAAVESSSSSSSESEKETETKKEKLTVQPEIVPEPESVVLRATDSRSNQSLQNGVTLSLRLDDKSGECATNGTSSSSSSSWSSSVSSSASSSSEDEGQIKVIRRYDQVPDESDKEVAIIYDSVNSRVVNMNEIRQNSESSYSGESDIDEDVSIEGDEVVAGIINVTSGEKLTICQAVAKGLIPEKTGILLLEAQAATGSVVNPRTGVKLSVDDAVRQGVVDQRYKARVNASEGAYYGYLDPRKNESVPLFEAMKRGIFPRGRGMRLLEAQMATGGIVDPWTGNRCTLSGAFSKGLIDQSTSKILKNPEDHADFFDPNTKQRFSYGNLLSKCIRDLNTGLKFLYLEEKPLANVTHYQPDLLTFKSAFRRKVSLQELISAGLVNQRILDQFNRGKMSKDDLYNELKQFLIGDPPIAGIYNRKNHEVLTICQAVRRGLLRKGTALELLEAQAATGNIIDPQTGKQMSVNRAISVGLVDGHFASALRKAEFAILGYQSNKNSTIALFEAMKKGLVIEVHGIRLLDAQVATGGLIDPIGGYRIPLSVAVKRGMIDQRLSDTLANPAPDQKGYYDPNTDENLTYGELLRRTVVDKKKHIGMRLLPLTDMTPNVRVVSKALTKRKKTVIMNPKTNQPISLKQAVAAKLIDIETARALQLAHQRA